MLTQNKVEIFQAVPAPCADCPFRKDSRKESVTCENMFGVIDSWMAGNTQPHSCHKTDPRADGFKGGYNGPIKACAGSLACLQKSGVDFPMKTDPAHEELVWSISELAKVYDSAMRRIRRWNRKKKRILKHLGLREFDPMDRYITDGAVDANANEKEYFFQTMISHGFIKPRGKRHG